MADVLIFRLAVFGQLKIPYVERAWWRELDDTESGGVELPPPIGGRFTLSVVSNPFVELPGNVRDPVFDALGHVIDPGEGPDLRDFDLYQEPLIPGYVLSANEEEWIRLYEEYRLKYDDGSMPPLPHESAGGDNLTGVEGAPLFVAAGPTPAEPPPKATKKVPVKKR